MEPQENAAPKKAAAWKHDVKLELVAVTCEVDMVLRPKSRLKAGRVMLRRQGC